MNAALLIENFEKLSPGAQGEIEKMMKQLLEKEYNNSVGKTRKPRAEFGSLKGFVTYMADDFDAPLKEFHDYMYHISIEFIEKIEKLPNDKQQEIEALVDGMLGEIQD